MLIISKYFSTKHDYVNIIQVCKKYKKTLSKFRYNPISEAHLFHKIQTQYLYAKEDKQLLGIEKYVICYRINTCKYLELKNNKTIFKFVEYTEKDRKRIGNCVPDGVTNLELWSFRGCDSIEKISLPNSLTDPNANCFEGCDSLKILEIRNCSIFKPKVPCWIANIIQRNGVECLNIEVTKGDIVNNTKIIPKNPKLLASNCFEASLLQQIDIPKSIESIGDFCFTRCTFLTSIDLSTMVTSIGMSCFKYCKSLQIAKLPNIIVLPKHCFYGCYQLHHLTVSPELCVVKERCFEQCQNIRSLLLPNTIGELPLGCFENCILLQTIILQEGLTKINDFAFQNCKSLKQIALPPTVQYVGNNCFKGCEQLTSVIFPQQFKEIGNNCFDMCKSLKIIWIPRGIKKITKEYFPILYFIKRGYFT
ncbi:Leucine rich repeat protein [Entamoeba marina]